MHLQESTLFDLNLGVTQNVAQCPLHHKTYEPAKFEVVMFNGLGGYAFTRKYIMWPWPWGQCRTKCCPVPSLSCVIYAHIIWPLTLTQGHINVAQYRLHHVSYTPTKFTNSKWVWSGNTTITNCSQHCGVARKSHSTITRHQEDTLSKATSSLFPIKMIAILEWT